MDIIFDYAGNMIDIADAILEHSSGLSQEQRTFVETIHRRSVDFITQFMEHENRPLPQLRRFLNHDAMTPLTVVVGYAELMITDAVGGIGETYKEALGYIRDYALALRDEIDTLHRQLRAFMQDIGIPLQETTELTQSIYLETAP